MLPTLSFIRKVFIFLLTAVIFFGCHSSGKMETPTYSSDISKQDSAQKPSNSNLTFKPSDCTGAIPSPRTIKSVFPKTEFKLSKDSLTGYETVYLDKGDKFLITIGNCDWHTLSFRFNTMCPPKDSGNKKLWYVKGIDLMKGVVKGIQDSILIAHGFSSLQKYIDTASNIKLYDEIDYDRIDKTDFHSLVRIDSLKNIGNGKYTICISFAEGPL